MKKEKLLYKISIRNLFLISIISLVSAGCIGGCIKTEIPFTKKIISGTISGEPGQDLRVDKDISIAKVCGQFDIDTLKEQVKEEIQKLPFGSGFLSMLVNRIKIRNLWVEKITIQATVGDFSRFENVTLKIKVGNGEIDYGAGTFNKNRTEIVFEKGELVDIYPFIKDLPDGGCIEGTIHITGYNPQNDINFDANAEMEVKVSF